MTKKLSQIFYLVSIILTSVSIVCYIVVGIMFCTVIPTLYAAGKLAITIPDSMTHYFTADEFVSFAAVYYSTIMFSLSVFAIVSLIITVLAKKRQTKTLYILSIVFGVLSEGVFSVAAGILGLIGDRNSNNGEVINQ